MRISSTQQAFRDALETVRHAVAEKSPTDIIRNILVDVANGRVIFRTTDLTVGIECTLKTLAVDGEGRIALPSQLLSNVIKTLPNEQVGMSIDLDTLTATIECGKYVTNIRGMNADDFPPVPSVDDVEISLTVPTTAFREGIAMTAFAAATDQSRPVLSGVFFRVRTDNTLLLAAADGYRLSVVTMDITNVRHHLGDVFECIIPKDALTDLARISTEAEELTLSIDRVTGQIIVDFGDVRLFSRLISGKFPDFERVIPTQWTNRTVVNRAEFLNAVKLASYFATASQNIVKLTMTMGKEQEPNRLVISANASEIGDNRGELNGVMQGEDVQIAMNVLFLREVLERFATYQVEMQTQSADDPGVFRPLGDDSVLCLIMPMTIR